MSNINDNDEDNEDDEDADNAPQKVYKAPRSGAGKGYPDKGTDHLYDEKDLPSVQMREDKQESPPPFQKTDEGPPRAVKNQMFWQEIDENDNRPVTKSEMKKFEQMFWQEKKDRYWESPTEPPNEAQKAEQLCKSAHGELGSVLEKQKSGESTLNYSKELEKMMAGEAYQTQNERNNLCAAAFSELTNSMIDANILPRGQAKEFLGNNVRSNSNSFFRGKRKRRIN